MEEPEEPESIEVISDSFEYLTNDLRSHDENSSIVEPGAMNEAGNICKKRKIEKHEDTVSKTFESITNVLSFEDGSQSLVEQVAKEEALNLYRKIYSLHQCSNSDISTIDEDMKK
ncbi:unnamed protein product, partial [Meganyctiphanes norvegica]